MARKRKHDEDGSQSQPNLQQSSQAQRQTPKRSVASIGDDDRAEYPNLATSENAGSSRRKKPASSRIGRACDRCQVCLLSFLMTTAQITLPALFMLPILTYMVAPQVGL